MFIRTKTAENIVETIPCKVTVFDNGTELFHDMINVVVSSEDDHVIGTTKDTITWTANGDCLPTHLVHEPEFPELPGIRATIDVDAIRMKSGDNLTLMWETNKPVFSFS